MVSGAFGIRSEEEEYSHDEKTAGDDYRSNYPDDEENHWPGSLFANGKQNARTGSDVQRGGGQLNGILKIPAHRLIALRVYSQLCTYRNNVSTIERGQNVQRHKHDECDSQ